MIDRGHHHANMLSVEEAMERVISSFNILEPQNTPIIKALGQVLAEDIIAGFNIPPLDNAAMDGYAIQASSVTSASNRSPSILRVVGSIVAGELPGIEVNPGTAIRIMTGAPIPRGADAVVAFEDTDEINRRTSGDDLSQIGINVAVERQTHVRPAGEDVVKGKRALSKGTILRPPEIGLLASLGLSSVKVIRRPVVTILGTGDELLEPGEEYSQGKIYNSNSYSIAAEVLLYGGIPKSMGIARDNLESMKVKLRECLDSDMLVTSAGVSTGDYDVVKDILAQHGKIDFWSVRMRPAKPLAFGMLTAHDGKKVPHLGLPGNPVSALVAFEYFGRAAIYRMLGKTNYYKPTIKAILDEPIYNTDGRRVYARAIVTKLNGTYHARLTGPQGSNLLTSMSRANGLAICPENLCVKETGEIADVVMLDWPEEVF